MSNYRLLRSNRESGPFSLDHLVEMGLKPYDLIWVDGKSAAWRYPSEIPELKPFAPVLEEQPFDRFFKKPETPTALPVVESAIGKPSAVREEIANLQPNPDFSAYETRFLPTEVPVATPKKSRSVFVTMPKGQSPAASFSSPAPTPEVPRNTPTKPVINEYAATTPSREETTPLLETKYEQQLDDIKEMYVKTLQQRNRRVSQNQKLKTYGLRAAAVVGLLGAGLFLGSLVVKKPVAETRQASTMPSAEEKSLLALNDNTEDSTPEVTIPADVIERSLIPDANIANRSAATGRLEKPDPKIVYEDNTPETVKSSERIIRTNPVTEKSVPVKETPNYGYESTTHNSATGERAKTLRDEKNETGKSSTAVKNDPIAKAENFSLAPIPERLAGQLKVNSNDYKRVALGGIRDLRLTVTNGTAESLAKVVVELQYLKPNEEPLKTEMVSFRGIGPHESSTIRMPDTNRGIKVKYKIVEVVE